MPAQDHALERFAEAGAATPLSGLWRWHAGDDLAWAERGFDDGDWPSIAVPSTWAQAGVKDRPDDGGEAQFIGWYRLRVKLDSRQPTDDWGVVLGYVFSSYEIYCDGALLGGLGSMPPNPQMHYGQTKIFRLPESATGDGEVELAVRVYADPDSPGDGGIAGEPVAIGPLATLYRIAAREDLVLFGLAAIFLAAGLYHLELYRRRHRMRSYLWFGIFCCVYAVYTFLTSQWRWLLGDDFALLKRFEIGVAFLMAPLAMAALWSLSHRALDRWLGLYAAVTGLFLAVLLFFPAVSPIGLLTYWVPWAALGLLWATQVVMLAWWRGMPEGRILGVGFLIAAVAFGHDLLKALGWTQAGVLGAYGFAVFVAAMALSLAHRFTRVYGELDALRVDLSARVEERTAELAVARDEAQHASAAKSQFLAHMSHEIRTPMNGVLGLLELLQATSLDDRQRRYLQTARGSADTLLRIIDDVLDLSSIEAGRIELETGRFQLTELCRSVVELIRPSADAKGLTLHVAFDERQPEWVLGDAARLRQVLFNVLGNAVKFTEQGRIVFRIEPGEPGSEHVVFMIADTGIGFGSDTQLRIFGPFEQGDASTKRRFGGTGLGLAIARRLVEAAGGTIDAWSRSGAGSTFLIEMPLPPAEPPEHEDDHETSEKASLRKFAGCWVLLVEDDQVSQMVARLFLENLGIDVTVADDAESALEQLHAQADDRFDLVLMDCQLPRLDGYEATRQWRRTEARQARPRVPIVALTAHAIEGERERCLQAGMDDFLTKPIKPAELGATLSRWLGPAEAVDAASRPVAS